MESIHLLILANRTFNSPQQPLRLQNCKDNVSVGYSTRIRQKLTDRFQVSVRFQNFTIKNSNLKSHEMTCMPYAPYKFMSLLGIRMVTMMYSFLHAGLHVVFSWNVQIRAGLQLWYPLISGFVYFILGMLHISGIWTLLVSHRDKKEKVKPQVKYSADSTVETKRVSKFCCVRWFTTNTTKLCRC